jgi:hypothetical protein
MVGYTLLHVYPVLALAGIIGYFLNFIWLLIVAIYLARRRAIPISRHIPYLLLPFVVVGLSFVPYTFWAGLGGVRL